MQEREWSEITKDPKVMASCLVVVAITLLAIAVGYYLGWGMFFLVLGVFLLWLAYKVRKTLNDPS